jgi:hypothetical protein
LIQRLLELNSPDYGLAYLYFDHKQAQARKPSEYIASLLRQLEQPKETLTPSLREAFNTLSGRCQRPDLQTLKSLLVDSSQFFKARTFIVLDALDEGTENGAQEILESLKLLLSKNEKISVFISSRPNRHLEYIVLSFSTQTRRINVVAGEGAQSVDVRAYINRKLAKEQMSDDEKLLISRGISEKAKGLYCFFISVRPLIYVGFCLLGCI